MINKLSVIIGIAICVGWIGIAYAQTNSFTIGTFTIDASGTPAATVKPPTRNGTLAITADIPTAQQGNIIAGSANFANGVVTINFPLQPSAPACIATDTTAASPVRRTSVTNNSVTFEGVTNHGIDYVCTTKSN